MPVVLVKDALDRARGAVSLAHPRYTQVPIVCPGVGRKVFEEVVLVVDVARVVLDPAALDDAELEIGVDEDDVDGELLVDDAAEDAKDEVEGDAEDDDATDEAANDDDDIVDDATDDDATTDDADDEGEDEAGIAVVDPMEKVDAVVTEEEPSCATAAGFS